MATYANAEDNNYRQLQGQPDGVQNLEQVHARRNDYHLFPQIPPRNPINAPEPNKFDDVSLLALTTCLNFGLASIHGSTNNSTEFITISIMQQVAMALIIFSNILFARTFPRVAYFIDRLGVACAFASLFYATGTYIISGIVGGFLISIYAAVWGYYYYFN